jgi:hypothetical protein
MTKTCNSCKHFVDARYCDRTATIHRVWGHTVYQTAYFERFGNPISMEKGKCGPDGNLWEANPPRNNWFDRLMGRHDFF